MLCELISPYLREQHSDSLIIYQLIAVKHSLDVPRYSLKAIEHC